MNQPEERKGLLLGQRAFVLAVFGLVLGFALAMYLKETSPFTTVAPIAVGMKYLENVMERRS